MTNPFMLGLLHVLVPIAEWICDQVTSSFREISAADIKPDMVIATILVASQRRMKILIQERHCQLTATNTIS
ncbi:hypothetical protein EDC04DRAFT_2823495 [Pisolithus marmoratus]|nr:hypothetical protein EDC04DRAFT_2823495 [Pisolithus marmoratus]